MRLLSPKQLADAIGSSESSLKRWADEGLIRVTRTAGGHRRIQLSEAIRFIREAKMPILRPEVLGLAELADRTQAPTSGGEPEQLCALLKEGKGEMARGLILSLYLSGWTVPRICDGPVREAMHEIGQLWAHGPAGICIEHRATDICIQAINQLRTLLPENEDGPLAMGGGFPTDPYVLPSLCAAATLAASGFRAMNFGPNLPFDSLLTAVELHSPRLVWLSVSTSNGEESPVKALLGFAEALQHRHVHLTVGGRGLPSLALPPSPGFHTGLTMSELASFADGIRSSSTGA